MRARACVTDPRERGYAVLTASNAEDAASAKRLLMARCSCVLYMTGYPADLLKPYGAFESDPELSPKPFGVDDLLRRVREVLDDPRPRGLRSALDA